MPRRRPRCALRNFVRLGCSIAALLLSWLRRRFRRCRLCARFRRLVGAARRRDPARLWFTAGRACLFKRADRGRRPLRDLVALVYPDLDADAAKRGAGFGSAVVDVRLQRVQRDPALPLLVSARHVGAAEPSCDADAHALGAALHCPQRCLLDGAAVRDAALYLLGDRPGDERRFDFREPHLVDVDANAASARFFEPAAQLIYPLAAAADDDSRTRCVDADRDLVGVSLDLDARDAGIRQHPLDRAADAQVLVQLLSIVLVGVPLAVPGIDVAEAKAVGVNFLAHQPPSSTMIVILLRRRRMISARPRARGVMRRNLTPSPTNARVTRRCLGSML